MVSSHAAVGAAITRNGVPHAAAKALNNSRTQGSFVWNDREGVQREWNW